MAFLAVTAVVFLASVLQGITGFGSALVAAPLALLFVDKETSVIALTFVSVALNGFLVAHVRHPLDRRLFATLFAGSLAGLPAGLLLLRAVDTGTLRIAAGALSLAFALLLFRRRSGVPRSRPLAVVSGMLAGVLHSSISMSGPPVVLLLAGQGTSKDEARKTFAAFFLAMSLVTLLLFAAAGTFTGKGLLFGLGSVPAAFAGAFIGARCARHVSQRQFSALALVLVCLTGAVAIWFGVAG